MKRGLPSSTEVLRGDTPEYVSVPREEYEALKEGAALLARWMQAEHDCAEYVFTGDEGTSFCRMCEAVARVAA
jgi:hypothetical protein